MALERDPWSRVTYNGFAKSMAEAGPAPSAPASRPRRRRRRGLSIAGVASLTLLVAALVAGAPTFVRLWSGVPLWAALPEAFEVQASAPPAASPAPAAKPITMAAVTPPAPAPANEPPAAAALTHRTDAEPPRARRPTERRRPGISAEARERASEATAAANLAATVAPESTLSGQAASQDDPFLSRPQ